MHGLCFLCLLARKTQLRPVEAAHLADRLAAISVGTPLTPDRAWPLCMPPERIGDIVIGKLLHGVHQVRHQRRTLPGLTGNPAADNSPGNDSAIAASLASASCCCAPVSRR